MASSTSKQGNNPSWTRGEIIGRGGYAVVHMATVTSSDGVRTQMAVKTAAVEKSSSLQKEKRIFEAFRGLPEIVTCYSDEESFENGQKFYNLFLEYAPAGTLDNVIARSGNRSLPENDVREYAKMILKGLDRVHEKGFVHCDIKPKNILAFPEDDRSSKYQLKIADFGVALEPGQKLRRESWKGRARGTLEYMSPESVLLGEIGPALDIWSLGCTVVKMVAGESPWRLMSPERLTRLDFLHLLANKAPKIPEDMSESGKDFLKKCFERDPRKRWSAPMLLNHPYITGGIGTVAHGKKFLTPYKKMIKLVCGSPKRVSHSQRNTQQIFIF